jgi:aerobic carbon-monoxide dehydrogenase large subunit
MPPRKKFGFGQAVRRKEDEALLTGNGRYVADFSPEGLLHAVVVRSPHAHARFRIADVEQARAVGGVRAILTAADVAGLGPLPCMAPVGDVKVPAYPVLAQHEVLHVGDAVAFVVADTRAAAQDAAEKIAIDWEPLVPVVDPRKALDGAPPVATDRTGNLAYEMTLGNHDGLDAAFAGARHQVAITLINQRLVTNYLDTRGVVAEYDSSRDRITLTLGSQGAHSVRAMLADHVLKIPQDKLRVITPDVGGGFGTKLFCYREYALVAVAAKRLGTPVKWVAERSEHFLGDAQGRDNITTARLALDERGKFLALSVDTVANLGAYLSCYAPFIPFLGAGMLPGVYDVPLCRVRLRCVYTNTLPVDAYRGAGRPEAAYVIERLVDAAARDLKFPPDLLRAKNFIRPGAMPYVTATGKNYDSGDFAAHLARAKEIAEWDKFRHRRAQSRRAGKLRGIGIATYIEACGGNAPENAALALEGDGTVTVRIGTQTTGQGHHTAYAQLVADHLDLPPEQVRVIQGDTDAIATGAGTGGSSSIPCGGASVAGAAQKLADNLRQAAADVLEASAADLELANGHVRVVGTDRAIAFADLAQKFAGDESVLQANDVFVPPQETFPNGTHLAEVEVDPSTGAVELKNYVVVDDFGATLNPLLLAGQVHGGTVQGIGQALMERTVYDSSGQLLTASLLDYALPRAYDVPALTFETKNVPCRTNPLGVKGAGEAGAIGSCPAVVNAVVDALWTAYRIRHVDMPATPERVWRAIEEAKRIHTL